MSVFVFNVMFSLLVDCCGVQVLFASVSVWSFCCEFAGMNDSELCVCFVFESTGFVSLALFAFLFIWLQ